MVCFMAQHLKIIFHHAQSPEARKLVDIIHRNIVERCGLTGKNNPAALPVIDLSIEPGLGSEGFRIADGPAGEIRIIGNDQRGLLYGAGQFLHSSRYEEGRFVPGSWRGASCPEKTFRGIYFATHFHNYFHDAPIEEVEAYVEDLALWGFNHLMVWFDRHHYQGIDDPAAKQMVARLRAILKAGKSVGMSAGLMALANEGYANSPVELRADGATGRAHYGVELCPSRPEAVDLILREFEEEFEAFADIPLDCLEMFPYDQGGCACARCKPWGANGYLRIGEQVANLFKKRFPGGRVVLSTWLFDYPYTTTEEWEGLSRAFARRPGWVDIISADSHQRFPQYPLTHGVPGGLPLINFPEISMWNMNPWGGFGANPLPQRFQKLWNEVKDVASGGTPYLEGIYADINQVLYSRFYWAKDQFATDALKEYIAFEYSPDVVEDVLMAIAILEQNHGYLWLQDSRTGAVQVEPKHRTRTEKALALLVGVDSRLPPRIRRRWRWRILYLRALLDHELTMNNEQPTAKCEEAFDELTRIYHADKSESIVQPPSRKNIAKAGGKG